MDTKVGHYAFIIGIIIAIIAGLFPEAIAGTTLLLVILGVIVGFLNIQSKETTEFLVAAVTLIVAGSAGLRVIVWANLGLYLSQILGNIAVFVAPAAVVVAIKAIFTLAEK